MHLIIPPCCRETLNSGEATDSFPHLKKDRFKIAAVYFLSFQYYKFVFSEEEM